MTADPNLLLDQVQHTLGFVPNLMREMAAEPCTLAAYLELSERFAQTSFTPIEQQLILLSASVARRCGYCVPVHTLTATAAGASASDIALIRDSECLPDPWLETLRRASTSLMQTGKMLEGHLSNPQQLALILAISCKTLSTSVYRARRPELDLQFEQFAWP